MNDIKEFRKRFIRALGLKPVKYKNGYKVGNHVVVFIDGEYKCSCEDYAYRNTICKHILSVILYGDMNDRVFKLEETYVD